jgi:hypothetical protein
MKSTAALWPKHFDEAIRIMNWRLLVAQQRLDGYAGAVAHAVKRKSVFDKKVLANKPGEVIFSKGQLVQVYRSDLDDTFKTERKILPKWSPPYRITSKALNSYTIETLIGAPVNGRFSARRLRRFWPREGTELARAQKQVEERCRAEEEEQERVELKKIAEERQAENAEERRRETAEIEQQMEGDEQLVGTEVGETDEDLEAEEDAGWEAEEEEDLTSEADDNE